MGPWKALQKAVCLFFFFLEGFAGGSKVKNLPAMQGTQEMCVESLG